MADIVLLAPLAQSADDALLMADIVFAQGAAALTFHSSSCVLWDREALLLRPPTDQGNVS